MYIGLVGLGPTTQVRMKPEIRALSKEYITFILFRVLYYTPYITRKVKLQFP